MLTKKEKTQKNIINSAIKLFSQNGYNATTTALIAKDAGVSEAILFKYFKKKEGLLKEIGSIAVSQIIENISLIPLMNKINETKESSLKDFIKAIIIERLEFLEKNFETVKLILIEMQYSKELKTQVGDLIIPKVFDVANGINNIIKHKANIPQERASAVTRMLLGYIESIAIQKYLIGIKITDKEIKQEVNEIIEIIEKGVL